jgi:murein L,D-transpeptidase YcbB/YkuD
VKAGAASRDRALGSLLGLALATAALCGPAAWASDSNDWMRFSSRDTYANRAYEREFIKEWEANPPRGYATVSAANIEPLNKAIKLYAAIVERGGWQPIPEGQLEVGSSGPAVALLRERLRLSGDLRGDSGFAEQFDYDLEQAVKRFQAASGLPPTGVVDKRTLAALNVPASARLHQLKLNLGRIQQLVRGMPKKYVLVNIPAAQIEAVEAGRVVSRHAAVVGKSDRPTPILQSAIHEMNFNPVWTLPPTVIDKDLIPRGREMQKRDQNVLVKFGIDAYGSDGRKLDPHKINWSSSEVRNLVYRQQPGKENPLGFLKINFHNNYSVYLHDTPSESLFGRNFRAASSGCVRVQNIEQLAAWLLADGNWTPERIAAMKESGERKDVAVRKPVPLYMAYITAWATEDGVIQFRRDIYQKDGVGAEAAAY